MTNWYKKSSYGYVEDLANQLLRIHAAMGPCKDKECTKLLGQVQAAYNNLMKFKGRPYNDKDFQGARFVASSLIGTIAKLPQMSNKPIGQELSETGSGKDNWAS